MYFCGIFYANMGIRFFYIYRAIAHYRGMERIFADKINNLIQMYGYDVWLITADQGLHPLSYFLDKIAHGVDLDIRFHLASESFILRRPFVKIRHLFVKHLKDLIAQQKSNLLICITDVFTNLVMLSKGMIPSIVESHSICRQTYKRVGNLFHRKILRWYTFWNYRHASSLVALTDSGAKEWQKLLCRSYAITNVVHQNPAGRISSQSSNRVIFTSHFTQQKGIPNLLEIWKRVHLHHSDWLLDIYAQGEQREVYFPEIKELEINIQVNDGTPVILNRYCDSSIFVLTSIYEHFMGCGLPVVSFDCDYGPQKIVIDSDAGYLVPSGDVEGFAIRIYQLVENQQLRKIMGWAGILSSKRYSSEIIMPQ